MPRDYCTAGLTLSGVAIFPGWVKKPPFHRNAEAHRDKPGGSPVELMRGARKNCQTHAFDIPQSIPAPPERTVSEHSPRLSAPQQLSNSVIKNAYENLEARKPNIYPRDPRNPRFFYGMSHLAAKENEFNSIPNPKKRYLTPLFRGGAGGLCVIGHFYSHNTHYIRLCD